MIRRRLRSGIEQRNSLSTAIMLCVLHPVILLLVVPLLTTTTSIITTDTFGNSNNNYYFVVVNAYYTATPTTSRIHIHPVSHMIQPPSTFTFSTRIHTPYSSSFKPTIPTTTTTTTSTRRRSTVQCHLSFFDTTTTMFHWDDIVYQTESFGNAIASFSLQPQQPSSSSDSGTMMMMNTHHDTSNNNMLLALPIMYLAGLLTSFSPCVWGLLPLTISYISTAANERSDQRTFLPTIAFATGLAFVFCTMGMITVFTVGTVFGGSGSSNGAATAAMSASNGMMNSNTMAYTTTMILPILSNLVCFIMGLKLLELIDITLPSLTFLDPQNMFSSASSSSSTVTGNNNNRMGGGLGSPILLDATGRQIITSSRNAAPSSTSSVTSTTNDDDSNHHEQRQKDTNNKDNNALFRTFLLGGSSALVASPCATPVLTSILAYVANTMAITEATSSSSSHTILTTILSTLMGGLLLFGYTLGYSTPLLIVAATGGQALVRLKQQQNPDANEQQHSGTKQPSSISTFLYSIPNRIAPWVTPITGGILLYLGTTGLLVNLIGDPSLSGLTIIE